MIQNEQNRLDPNLLQASTQGPLNFTHNLSVIFYASICFPVPKPVLCVLGFCYCSALFLVPQSAPAVFCDITNATKLHGLQQQCVGSAGRQQLVSLPCSVSCGGLTRTGGSTSTTVFACSHVVVRFQEWMSQEVETASKIYIRWNVHIFIYNLSFN